MTPNKINFRKKSQLLELGFPDGTEGSLSAEFLRVHSPSAEVRGHGVGQETLQTGKKDVQITDIQPTGNYALKIIFSDGHDSGLFNWNYLYDMCQHQDDMWQSYLEKLEAAGASREPPFINAKPL